MKYLTAIWAILILTLACLPCTDSGMAYANDRSTTVQADDFHHDGTQDADLCSPLCECNCCGGISFAVSSFQVTTPIELPCSVYISPYHSISPPSPSFTFWHPPKA